MQVTLYYAAIWVWFGCSVIGKVWSCLGWKNMLVGDDDGDEDEALCVKNWDNR